MLLVAAVSPVILASVAVRFALLYLLPTLIATGIAMTASDVSLLRAVGVWILAILASVANEHAFVRPTAERAGVAL